MIYYDEIGKKCSVNSSPLQHGESLFPYHLIGSVDNGLPALMKWDRQGIFIDKVFSSRGYYIQMRPTQAAE